MKVLILIILSIASQYAFSYKAFQTSVPKFEVLESNANKPVGR